MILLANEATRLTNANLEASEQFLLNTELYNIQRDIIKAIRKKRFNTQLAYLISPDATTQLTAAGYGIAVNEYGTVISWV